MVSVREGAKLGLTECKKQFNYEKWNCSVTFRNKRLADMPIFVQSSLPLGKKKLQLLIYLIKCNLTQSTDLWCAYGLKMLVMKQKSIINFFFFTKYHL